jgi:hypothetical protein
MKLLPFVFLLGCSSNVCTRSNETFITPLYEATVHTNGCPVDDTQIDLAIALVVQEAVSQHPQDFLPNTLDDVDYGMRAISIEISFKDDLPGTILGTSSWDEIELVFPGNSIGETAIVHELIHTVLSALSLGSPEGNDQHMWSNYFMHPNDVEFNENTVEVRAGRQLCIDTFAQKCIYDDLDVDDYGEVNIRS